MVRDISTINKTTGKNIPGVREAPNRGANSKIFRDLCRYSKAKPAVGLSNKGPRRN